MRKKKKNHQFRWYFKLDRWRTGVVVIVDCSCTLPLRVVVDTQHMCFICLLCILCYWFQRSHVGGKKQKNNFIMHSVLWCTTSFKDTLPALRLPTLCSVISFAPPTQSTPSPLFHSFLPTDSFFFACSSTILSAYFLSAILGRRRIMYLPISGSYCFHKTCKQKHVAKKITNC